MDFTPDEKQPEGLGFTPDVGFTPDAAKAQPEELKEPTFEEGSFGNRVSTALQGRLENTQESARMMAEDEQTYLEAAAQGFGQVIMGYNDVVSESVLEVLDTMTPDAAQDWLGEYIDAGADHLMSTETAQSLFNEYMSLDPRARKNLDAAVNIGLAVIPMKTRMGKKLYEAGKKSEKNSLGRYLLDQGTSAKAARNAEMGMDKARQNVLNREDAVLNTALSVKGVSSSTPRPKMMAALNTEVARLGTDIKKALAGSTMRVPKGTVTKRVNSRLVQFMNENPQYRTKHLQGTVKKALDAYLAANKKYTGKPSELLDVRRQFDKTIDDFFKADIYNGNDTSRRVVAAIRDELNTIIQETAPDAKIRDAMQRQHHIMIAKDNLAFNMATEKSAASKVVAKVEHHPFLVGGALTGTGAASSMMNSELLGAGGLLLGGSYIATRPSVMKATGAVVDKGNLSKSLLVNMLNEQMQEQEQQ